MSNWLLNDDNDDDDDDDDGDDDEDDDDSGGEGSNVQLTFEVWQNQVQHHFQLWNSKDYTSHQNKK